MWVSVCVCVCEWVDCKQDHLIPWLVMSKAYRCDGMADWIVCVFIQLQHFSHFDNYHKGKLQQWWVFALKCWREVQEACYHWHWYVTAFFPPPHPTHPKLALASLPGNSLLWFFILSVSQNWAWDSLGNEAILSFIFRRCHKMLFFNFALFASLPLFKMVVHVCVA